jgi:hypothetical protein
LKLINQAIKTMKIRDEIEEPLNPYSRLFMIVWALATIIVVGFRTGDDGHLAKNNRRVGTSLSGAVIAPTVAIVDNTQPHMYSRTPGAETK